MAIFVCITALSASAMQAPQQQPATPPQPPTFRAEANLVRVDVTVVDRKGEPVTTLTAEDFAVEEDGVAQTVQSFKFVSADGGAPAGDEDSLPIRSPEHAAAEAARDDIRVFVIFWDEYHIGRMAEAIKGKRALTTFVSTAFGVADLVALMDPLVPVDALRFTRDRHELTEKIGKLEGRFGWYTPTRSAAEDNMMRSGDVERLRSEVTISALRSAAVHLGSIKEGRKAIIFVSEGLPGLGMDQIQLVSELTDTANNNNTAIYTVDPAGLNGGSADVLRTIAENTGAEAFVNTNAPEKGMRQIVREASAFYLLGYTSSRNPQDGRFHKIGVKVKRPGIDVRARRGYWAPNATEIEKARTESASAKAVPADITNAAAVLKTERTDRLVDLWVGSEHTPGSDTNVTVAWTARTPAARTDATRTISVVVKGAGGDRTFEARLDAGMLSFPSPPGVVQLSTTVRDGAGNALDEDRRTFSVPDFSATALTLDAPVLLRARTVADARALATGAPAAPFAGREFIRTDRLFIRVAVRGTGAAEAEFTAQLTTKAGALLMALPAARMSGTDARYQIDVPLASIARGEYLIAISATHSEERTRTLVPVRVMAF